MNKLNKEMSITSDLLQIKSLVREFQQISYSFKQFESKFPDIEFASEDQMLQYIKIAIAYKTQIEEILIKFNEFYLKYGK